MQPIAIRGDRQRRNAEYLIKELANPELANWLSERKETLMVGNPLSKEQVEQWVKYHTLASGTVLTIQRWRNDCECSPEAPIGATGHCKGHNETIVVDDACDCQPFTLFIDGWRADQGVDAISVYAFGVHIGSRAR